MGLICRDGKGVSVVATTGEDHKDTLPISAGYLEVIKKKEEDLLSSQNIHSYMEKSESSSVFRHCIKLAS